MNAKINSFLGLATSLSNPTIGTANAVSNFIRHKVRGWLQLGNGYATKFAVSGTANADLGLPQITVADGTNYLKPAIHKISSLVWKDIHNFYVPDHGGQNITVVAGTYTKTGFENTPTTKARFGVWMRPYWNGSWINAWLELTEMYIFEVKSLPGGKYLTKIYVADLNTNMPVNDPTGIVFNNSNFIGWTIVYGDLDDSENFDMVYACGYAVDAAPCDILSMTDNHDGTWSLHTDSPIPKVTPTATQDLTVDGVVYLVTVLSLSGNYDAVVQPAIAYTFPVGATTITLSSTYSGYTKLYYLQLKTTSSPGTNPATGHKNNDYPTRTSGTKLWVYRNFLYKDVPSEITSYIFTMMNEIRLTSGNTVNDVSLMAAFMNKALQERTIDGLILESAALDVWEKGIRVGAYEDTGRGTLTNGTYYLKYSIVNSVGSGQGDETKLFDVATAAHPSLALTTGNVFVVAGSGRLALYFYLSAGAYQKTASLIRLYYSKDNLVWYLAKVFDIATITDSVYANVTIDSSKYHYYKVFGTTGFAYYFDNADLAAGTIEANTERGMGITETGVIRWKTGTVIGKTTYVGNTLSAVAGAQVHPNQVMVCVTDGDGVNGVDVFPSDGAHIIDVEYSDGDEVVALAPLVERILVLKKKSIVFLSPDGQGGYTRELVSRQVGCASQNAVVAFDDVIYWADYTGVYSYDTRGLTLLNLSWLQDWKDIASATKEAMFAEIDKKNKQYILFNGATVYRYDLIDQEWMTDAFPLTGIAAAADLTVDGTVDFITADKLETINRVTPTAAVDYDGAGYTSSWESNKIYPLREGDGEAANILLKGIAIEYSSPVAISVDLYLDDGATVQTTALAANKTFATIYAPLSSVCKAYRLKFTVTVPIGGLASTFAIKSVTHYFDIMPTGGDVIAQ